MTHSRLTEELSQSMSECTVRLPPQDELARLWHVIEPLLAKATARTRCFDPVDLLAFALAGQWGIWIAEIDGEIVAAMVTRVQQYPRRRVLEVPYCGGSRMKEWLPLWLATVKEHQQQTGCDCIAATGREGWAKLCGAVVTDAVMVLE